VNAADHRPALGVIVASTRPGRAGRPIAEWFAELAPAGSIFEVRLLDLKEEALPFLDEPHHPRMRQYTHQHTREWSAKIEACDAFVFVMPEYNYAFNAPLKNALDYLHYEWQHKPVGLVSYGGVSAGTRAAQMIKQVVTTLKMLPVFEAVSIPFFPQYFVEDREFRPNDLLIDAALEMLRELETAEQVLRSRRLTGNATDSESPAPRETHESRNAASNK
jgi:NAD(P)H-dependent FMN reductase